MKKSIKLTLSVIPLLLIGLFAIMNMNFVNPSINEDDSAVVNENLRNFNFEKPFENHIAFKNDPSKEINKEEITSYWNEQLDLEEPVEFKDFKIIFSDPGEYDKQYFMISARSVDGRTSIGSHLNIVDDMFLMTSETCSCTTSDCTQMGCEVEAGPGCSCSYCSGTCTKKHTKEVEEN